MLLRLQNAAASMSEMVRQQERISNNLANANTIGYKRQRFFIEVFEERLDAEGAPRSSRRFAEGADFSPGPLEKTGNPLDLALGGAGFFVVRAADGATRFTRAGRFTLNAQNSLVTPRGDTIMGENGPITIPPEAVSITISKDGAVTAGQQLIGRLRIVEFADPQALQRVEGSAFTSATPPQEVAAPEVLQGHIENSNVNPILAMTDMITHFRQFESQQRSLRTADQLLGRVTQDLGRY